MNGYKSPEAKLKCGTAQGSILGPLFYILYVNDIFSYVTYNKSLTMYADDTLLIEQGESQESSIQSCQETLNEVVAWCKLNSEKTKAMLICPNPCKDLVSITLNISQTPLHYVKKYEYLDVTLDNKLNMNNHIESIVKRVQAKLHILRKFRKHITENTALRIYKTLITCHMDYGDFLIESGTKEKVERLDRLQTRIIRYIENRFDVDKQKDLPESYGKYNLEPLEIRRKSCKIDVLGK